LAVYTEVGAQVRPAAETRPDVRHYVCFRTVPALTIDGSLDETAWQAAPWSESFVDIVGGDRPPPHLRTRVKLLWDDSYLYVAAELEEPHVWAAQTDRDAVIYRDNDFEIFIDPDGDGRDYYELEINALGTVWDLFLPTPYREGGRAVNEWDIEGLRAAVAVDGTLNDPSDLDRGWTVEIALPWSAFAQLTAHSRPPRVGESWRVNFSRVQWHTEVVGGSYRKLTDVDTGKPLPEENWVWSPQGAVDMHRPEMWGVVEFSATPGDY
jgi:hypothetical protein